MVVERTKALGAIVVASEETGGASEIIVVCVKHSLVEALARVPGSFSMFRHGAEILPGSKIKVNVAVDYVYPSPNTETGYIIPRLLLRGGQGLSEFRFRSSQEEHFCGNDYVEVCVREGSDNDYQVVGMVITDEYLNLAKDKKKEMAKKDR